MEHQPQSNTFDSSSTTPRPSLEQPFEKMKPIKSLGEQESADSNTPQIPDRTHLDSSDENVAREKDLEKGPERQTGTEPGPAEQRNGPQEEHDPNLVGWDGPHDPENPMNWSNSFKWVMTVVMASMTMVITFASSVFSTATFVTAEKYHVSTEVTLLGTSLFVLGFAFGPPIWGPFSEVFGRKIPLFTGFAIMAIFQIPVAVAQNIETIMICRFLSGLSGCAPLAVVGGALADIWPPVERGVATAVFSGAVFIGPVAGPIVGGFITQSYLGWRWTAWITLIMAAFTGVIGLLVVPETFPPVLHQRKARHLRHATKNWALHSRLDESRITPHGIVVKYIFRPFQMLIFEPILLLVTIYMGFVYGILYLFFEAYPISFQEERGWNLGVGGLPFLSITIGVVIGAIGVSWLTKSRIRRSLEEHGEVVPEERLLPMIVGGFLLPVGLFWFAWTSDKDITWVPQVISGIPIGLGILMIFMQSLNYIIDVYLMFANSAIAGNTFLRSLSGAGFPLFAMQMYHRLGVDWATTLLAFLCVAMIPIPILFYRYGQRLRQLSRFSPTL